MIFFKVLMNYVHLFKVHLNSLSYNRISLEDQTHPTRIIFTLLFPPFPPATQ